MTDLSKSYDLADTITALGVTLSANMRDVANAQTNKIQGILLEHQVGNKGRFDHLEEANARVLAAVGEAVRGLGKRIDDVEEGQRQHAGQISDIGERLDEAEAALRTHGVTIQSHNESRDRSIEQREWHEREITVLHQGRQDNADGLAALREEVQHIHALLKRVAARVGENGASGGE